MEHRIASHLCFWLQIVARPSFSRQFEPDCTATRNNNSRQRLHATATILTACSNLFCERLKTLLQTTKPN